MTAIERLKYVIDTEIDQYINLIWKNITMNQDVRKYVSEVVIPRFKTLRERVMELEKELNMFTRDYSILVGSNEELICIPCNKVMDHIDHFHYKALYRCSGCNQEANFHGEYDAEICATPEQMDREQEEYLRKKNEHLPKTD